MAEKSLEFSPACKICRNSPKWEASDVSLPSLWSQSSKPLEGIHMIELARVLIDSVGGQLLSEMGATIIQVIDKLL